MKDIMFDENPWNCYSMISNLLKINELKITLKKSRKCSKCMLNNINYRLNVTINAKNQHYTNFVVDPTFFDENLTSLKGLFFMMV